MKINVFVYFLILSLPVWAENPLIGKWKGYCTVVNQSASRLCSYTFLNDGKGSYSCEFYSDLRCEKKTEKQTNFEFRYMPYAKSETKITFQNGDEQIVYFSAKGDLLSETGLKLKNRSEKKFSKMTPILVHYTRVQ